VLRYSMRVTSAEQTLVETIQKLRFGEMYSLKVGQTPDVQFPLTTSANVRDLLELLREWGRVDVLTVHEGEPVTAELDYQENGYRCRKRIKFPTTKTEG
jgi:hypothetical protein